MGLSHVARMNIWREHIARGSESCHAYQTGMSHKGVSHVTHIKQACRTRESAMSRTSKRHVAQGSQPCHAHQRGMSHGGVSNVTHQWGMSHRGLSHVTHIVSLKHVAQGSRSSYFLSFFHAFGVHIQSTLRRILYVAHSKVRICSCLFFQASFLAQKKKTFIHIHLFPFFSFFFFFFFFFFSQEWTIVPLQGFFLCKKRDLKK